MPVDATVDFVKDKEGNWWVNLPDLQKWLSGSKKGMEGLLDEYIDEETDALLPSEKEEAASKVGFAKGVLHVVSILKVHLTPDGGVKLPDLKDLGL